MNPSVKEFVIMISDLDHSIGGRSTNSPLMILETMNKHMPWHCHSGPLQYYHKHQPGLVVIAHCKGQSKHQGHTVQRV